MSVHTIYKSEAGKKRLHDAYEAYLQRFEVDFERVYVHTRYGPTHTLVTGPTEGKPLFIFQGGNCVNPMTLSWFSALLQGYRIYAPDTIGHPGFSAETRISAKDDSFAHWVSDLTEHFGIERCAFIGPSYGAGIILRLATYMPDKIACSVLVAPSGLCLGPMKDMVARILLPMMRFKMNSSPKQMQKIANAMSDGSMKEMDRDIIGDIFTHVKLEQNMPKVTEKRELERYYAPTMVIAGDRDLFFPAGKVMKAAKEVIPNLAETITYDMGHFPSERNMSLMNGKIKQFLDDHYNV